ncbi:MAG: hypothetical protein NT037_17705 [Hyphomicrobiales bacterium]|nr:hypothetical protein [Hyphomicrobiales bacterium]
MPVKLHQAQRQPIPTARHRVRNEPEDDRGLALRTADRGVRAPAHADHSISPPLSYSSLNRKKLSVEEAENLTTPTERAFEDNHGNRLARLSRGGEPR